MVQHCGTGVSYSSCVIINMKKKRIFKPSFSKIACKPVIIISKIAVKISSDIANVVLR